MKLNTSDPICRLTVPANNIVITLYYTGNEYTAYQMLKDDSILFQGNDYKPSPLNCIDSLQSILDLFGFLTVQSGDTDKEYFKNYTPEQLAFADSFECENLHGLIMDLEDEEGEYYQDALKQIKFEQL